MFTDILWDFDGTLFDTYPGIVDTMLRALADEGVREDYGEVMTRMRVSVSGALAHYRKRHRLGDSFLTRYDKYNRDVDRWDARLFAHAVEVLKAIHVSGKRNYLYTHRGHSALDYLRDRGLTEYFTDCITREEGFPPKPSPDAIRHLIDTHGIKKENAIMVGDREIDILAAKHAGIYGCFFSPDESITCESADYTVRSLLELAPITGIEL